MRGTDAKKSADIRVNSTVHELRDGVIAPPNTLGLRGHFWRNAVEHGNGQMLVVVKNLLFIRVTKLKTGFDKLRVTAFENTVMY